MGWAPSSSSTSPRRRSSSRPSPERSGMATFRGEAPDVAIARARRKTMASALLMDFYELTMVDAYLSEGLHDEAAFSLFVRRLPARRNYLLACGLEQALTYLETLRFSPEELAWLESLGCFSQRL